MGDAAVRALVTGITGQDGSFLAELLLEKGYAVTGMLRGSGGSSSSSDSSSGGSGSSGSGSGSSNSGDSSSGGSSSGSGGGERALGCSEHLRGRIALVEGDLLDAQSLHEAVARSEPREIYHLAAPSFVPDSWRHPEQSMRAIVGGTAALLEAVRERDRRVREGRGREQDADAQEQRGDARGRDRRTRIYVAASGAMYGDAGVSPQREDTPCRPSTPYAIAKLAAHQLVGTMRAEQGLWACSGIVFNHESERRPMQFVTRRITRGVAEIALGRRSELTVGDLQAVRDWSFAGDIMRGAWLMLQQERPEDYVLAGGVAHTVGELARVAFACVGLQPEGHLRIDPALVRAPERTPSVGDPSRARERLGWTPRLSFEELVQRMVDADLRELRRE
jgi:GDPmannose 4,6-dehydratase